MAVYRICNLEGLRFVTKRLPSLWTCESAQLLTSPAVAAALTYATFFSIWHQLQSRCGHESFDIVLSAGALQSYIVCTPLDLVEPGRNAGVTDSSPATLIGFPDPQVLAARSEAKCRARRERGDSMVIQLVWEDYRLWSFCTKSGRRQQRMFEILDSNPQRSLKRAPLAV